MNFHIIEYNAIIAVSIIYWLFVSWGSLLKPFGLNRKPVARKSKTGWKYQTFFSTKTFDTHTHWIAHTQKKSPNSTQFVIWRGRSEGETNLFRVFLWLIFIFFSIRDVLNNLLWGTKKSACVFIFSPNIQHLSVGL